MTARASATTNQARDDAIRVNGTMSPIAPMSGGIVANPARHGILIGAGGAMPAGSDTLNTTHAMADNSLT